MKHFWKKKLPAVLLTLALMIGMVPAAMAEGETGEGGEPSHTHTWSEDWSRDASQHWHACTGCGEKGDVADHDFTVVTDTPPTCYQPGSKISRCAICGYEVAETPGATGNHVYGSEWKYDLVNHWHACTTSGCTATKDTDRHMPSDSGSITEPTCTTPGSIRYTCVICGQPYTVQTSAALGHSLDANGKCIRCGQQITTSVTVSFQTGGSSVASQSVAYGGRPTVPANPTRSGYVFLGWTTTLYNNYLYTGTQTYYSGSQIATIAVTKNTTYYALYQAGSYTRNISVTLDGTGGIYGNTATTKSSSMRDQLYSQFYSATGSTLYRVRFGSASGTSYGTLYNDSSLNSLQTSRDYYYNNNNSYTLASLYFLPSGNTGTYSISYTAYDSSGNAGMTGTVSFVVGNSASKITYTVAPGQSVALRASDFNDAYRERYSDTVRWVTFSTSSTLNTTNGTVYYNYGGNSETAFTKSSIDDYKFYYNSSGYGDYPLNDLTFAAGSGASSHTVTLSFRAYYSTSRYVDGTVEIKVTNSAASSLTYTVAPGQSVGFQTSGFNSVYQEEYNDTVRWVTFSAPSTLNADNGVIYYNYGASGERAFTRSTLDDYKFYYSSSSYGDYPLGNLTFVASDDFDTTITLSFRAYYSTSRYVDGTLSIKPSSAVDGKGDVLYYTTYTTNVQINPNDIARFFNAKYPSNTFQYAAVTSVPSAGSLYYNYYGTSSYGSSQLRLTNSNCDNKMLYFSPTSTSQYSLSELTYIPSGSNYCAAIPFTAYGSGSRSVSGTILISVSYSTVADVYGATPKGTAVTFPASAISSAVSSATGTSLSSIQLLSLPSSSSGVVYVGTGSTRANTTTRYGYSSGSQRISQLRFVPASGFTGSVELPYVAYNSSNKAIASGKFCLGVVNRIASYSDMNASTWCYKYVVELSDANVISGYKNGTFRPNNTVTYGEALKLIMLAAGYSAQNPTSSHWASGYLSRAKTDGLVSGTVKLDAPISRLAVAQIAAKAMKLSTSGLSSVKPFTDTNDVYVQALYGAGIVEGYFANGTSTYKPNNTLTRGQISAIVWRMERADG